MDLDRFDELADIGDWFLFDLFQGAEKTRLFMPADINISTGSFSKEFPDLKIFNGSFIKLLSYLSRPKIGQFCKSRLMGIFNWILILVKASVHQSVTVLLIHALREYSIGSHIVVECNLFGEFGQRTAGVVWLRTDDGLEKGIIFLTVIICAIFVGECNVEVFLEDVGVVKSHSFLILMI